MGIFALCQGDFLILLEQMAQWEYLPCVRETSTSCFYTKFSKKFPICYWIAAREPSQTQFDFSIS